MDSYSALLSRVLKDNVLAKHIHEKSNNADPHTLNLLTLDWKAHLQNHLNLYQSKAFRFPFKSPHDHYEYESIPEPLIEVQLVAYCRFVKPINNTEKNADPLMVTDSEPLQKIALHVMKDLGSNLRISEDSKYTFKNCTSSLGCNQCEKASRVFHKHGYPVKRTLQPCIRFTQVYNGKQVVNRFHNQMVDMFESAFVAILNLKINARYSYMDSNSNTKMYRMAGKVGSIVAFNEAKLDYAHPVVLGELENFESHEAGPSHAPPCTVPVESAIKKEIPLRSGKRKEEKNATQIQDEIDIFNVNAKIFENITDTENSENISNPKRPRVEEEFFSIDVPQIPLPSGKRVKEKNTKSAQIQDKTNIFNVSDNLFENIMDEQWNNTEDISNTKRPKVEESFWEM